MEVISIYVQYQTLTDEIAGPLQLGKKDFAMNLAIHCLSARPFC